jgi:hypothetical protein
LSGFYLIFANGYIHEVLLVRWEALLSLQFRAALARQENGARSEAIAGRRSSAPSSSIR